MENNTDLIQVGFNPVKRSLNRTTKKEKTNLKISRTAYANSIILTVTEFGRTIKKNGLYLI